MRNVRLQVAIAAVVAGFGLASSASATILNDAANGAWDVAATWGGSVPVDGDELTIDSNTVSFNKVGAGDVTITIPAVTTINIGGTGIYTSSYGTSVNPTVRVNLNLNDGGRMEWSRGSQLTSGVNLNISGNTHIFNNASNETPGFGAGTTVANSAVVTGAGTLNKTGGGTLQLLTIGNVLDADGSTAGNQTRTNGSTFSGTYNIDAGLLEVTAPEFTKFATVKLGGTVAGTQAGYSAVPTAAELDAAPRLSYGTSSTTYIGTQPQINNLLGTGRVLACSNTGYYRDIAVGTLLDPGSAAEAGLIKRHTSHARHDLVMRPGSTMAFDVFSATSADQVDWTDSVSLSGMVFNEANLDVRLFTPAADTGPLSWTLILGDEWISKATQGNSTSTAIADQFFADIDFLNAAGSADALLYVAGVQSGWKDLAISYGGTMGNSDRTVVLSGEYVLVPEPGVVALLAASGMLLGLRRQRKA